MVEEQEARAKGVYGQHSYKGLVSYVPRLQVLSRVKDSHDALSAEEEDGYDEEEVRT